MSDPTAIKLRFRVQVEGEPFVVFDPAEYQAIDLGAVEELLMEEVIVRIVPNADDLADLQAAIHCADVTEPEAEDEPVDAGLLTMFGLTKDEPGAASLSDQVCLDVPSLERRGG